MDDMTTVGHRLRADGPDRLAEAAAAYVTERFGAESVELLLADYRVAGLRPVLAAGHDAGGPLGDATAVGRVYAGQQALVDARPHGGGARAYVPVSAWRDRLGVLVVDLPERPDPDTLDRLCAIGDELAMALSAADRTTDRYRRARRTRRMSVAAETQWDLLPGRTLGGADFTVAGQLEPAYEVCGDHFDWALNGRRLTLTVLNGSGSGIAAALLTVLAVNAMRNARRSAGGLVDQAELASEALYSQHAGKECVATLLIELDLDTGRAAVIDAGSPIVLRYRGGAIDRLEFHAQMPLGMFGDNRYEAQSFELAPGDRLVVVSDGVHAAAPGGREAFGDRLLARAVRDTRLQPAADAVAAIMRLLRAHHDGDELDDDAVIVCLDYPGGASSSGSRS